MRSRPLQKNIIYGPVNSRRLGRSLGVNILPTVQKVCTFDCIYCQYGWTDCSYTGLDAEKFELPSPVDVEKALEQALASFSGLDAITLAGNGESSVHPSFDKITESTARLRDRFQSGVPVCILSNSSTLDSEKVQGAFKHIDRKIMKLDAGTEETFRKIHRPAPDLSLEKVVAGLERLERPEIQTLFFNGPLTNSSEKEVFAWLGNLGRIKPVAVQIYTLDRVPADQRLRTVSDETLEHIADLVHENLSGTEVQVY